MAARRRARTLPSARQGGTKLIASNRRARHDYELLDVVEAGVVLTGSEVKSLRFGHVQLADGFARGDAGELWLEGVHISPYQFATDAGAHDPDRRRKLLLHRDEIDRLQARVAQERLALVPAAACTSARAGPRSSWRSVADGARPTSARPSPSGTRSGRSNGPWVAPPKEPDRRNPPVLGGLRSILRSGRPTVRNPLQTPPRMALAER